MKMGDLIVASLSGRPIDLIAKIEGKLNTIAGRRFMGTLPPKFPELRLEKRWRVKVEFDVYHPLLRIWKTRARHEPRRRWLGALSVEDLLAVYNYLETYLGEQAVAPFLGEGAYTHVGDGTQSQEGAVGDDLPVRVDLGDQLR
jgi:hypothetical protein